MSFHPRSTAAMLVLLTLAGLATLLAGPGAHADDGATVKQALATNVYDVRVVRLDPADGAVVEAAPPWQPSGAAGATTTSTWADLLAGLKSRGRTTLLLDQRLTAIRGSSVDFRQDQKRPVLSLMSRSDKIDTSSMTYVETGARGQLAQGSQGLTYDLTVTWEDRPTADGTGPIGSASWKGSHSNLAAGETLVLSYRQQQIAAEAASRGLEIYVFVTGWSAAPK